MFLSKFQNMKSDLQKSSTISQHGGQLHITETPVYYGILDYAYSFKTVIVVIFSFV